MTFFKRWGSRFVRKLISIELGSFLINRFAEILRINLLELAQKRNGILNFSNSQSSGERYLIEDFLQKYYEKMDKGALLFFDVGANIGKYTRSLKDSFPDATIYSFEPNPNTFKILENNFKTSDPRKIKICRLGLSSFSGPMELTSYEAETTSSHASLHKEVFEEFHSSVNNISIEAEFTTVDEFCASREIERIHLLKIDTEGHELEVLKGAARLIEQGGIDVVQFEFGECHVYSRVFLRDFYTLLSGYKFHRLLSNRLMPLGEHSPAHEIFRFQNIVAIK